MATKENSIKEGLIHDGAARAVPGIASTTLRRRELLTGAALVFVGSASGCCWGNSKPLRTQFMADFTKAFIGDPTTMKEPGQTDPWPGASRLWPVTGQGRTDIVADFVTFGNVLLTVAYVGGPPPTYPSGSLAARILQFLQAQNWPNGTPIPPEYSTERGTVNLVEISVIQDRLLQSINSFDLSGSGSGGSGSNWPPH